MWRYRPSKTISIGTVPDGVVSPTEPEPVSDTPWDAGRDRKVYRVTWCERASSESCRKIEELSRSL